MKSLAMVDGNLALAPAARSSSFQVVDGRLHVSERSSAHEAQRMEPDRLHVIAAIALVCAFLVGMIALSQVQQARIDAAFACADRQEIVVESGDTLWSIAEMYGIEGIDTQRTVDVIRNWNGLSQSVLQPGDVIVVPD